VSVYRFQHGSVAAANASQFAGLGRDSTYVPRAPLGKLLNLRITLHAHNAAGVEGASPSLSTNQISLMEVAAEIARRFEAGPSPYYCLDDVWLSRMRLISR
jgi:hypothetical protein